MALLHEYHLPTRFIGRPVRRYDVLESTNTLALQLAGDPGHHGLVIWADWQTAGRGRFGRRWFAAPGSAVLISVVLFPPPRLQRPVIMTAWAAVAVCETVYLTTQRQPRIKWPNDVLLSGKKVCGILVEQSGGIVVGIGLNVTTPPQFFLEHNLANAASLACFTDQPLDITEVGQRLLERLDAGYVALVEGELGEIESAWRWYGGLWGRDVQVTLTTGERCSGRLREWSFDGLILERDGEPRLLLPEEIAEIEPLSVPGG